MLRSGVPPSSVAKIMSSQGLKVSSLPAEWRPAVSAAVALEDRQRLQALAEQQEYEATVQRKYSVQRPLLTPMSSAKAATYSIEL